MLYNYCQILNGRGWKLKLHNIQLLFVYYAIFLQLLYAVCQTNIRLKVVYYLEKTRILVKMKGSLFTFAA